MAERRRGKQRKREEQPEKPTKEEYGVAKFLRFNLPTREGKLVGMSVQCFIASKAVDLLMESKWGNKASKEPLFTSRAGCVDYCNTLLMKGLFHRAARVGRKKEKDRDIARKKKKLKEEEEVKETKEEKTKQEKKSKRKEKKKEKEEDEDTEKDKEKESEGEKDEKKSEEKKDEEKKKKRKFRLEMHDMQIFKDGDEIYVWIYDPVPFKTFMIGLLLVLGAIAVCMFPLWPPEVRLGIYYLSLAAAGFVGVILALCVVRLVLFCVVWGLTFGRHHFWFLPNLTEDVGFLDSFKPLYKHDYCGSGENQAIEQETTKEGEEEEEKGEEKAEEEEKGDQEEEERGSEKEGSAEGSEDNGYEIVEREDLIENEEEGEEGREEEEEEEEEEEGEEEEEEEEEQHEHENKKTK